MERDVKFRFNLLTLPIKWPQIFQFLKNLQFDARIVATNVKIFRTTNNFQKKWHFGSNVK